MKKLLEINDVFVEFHTDDGVVHALNGANLELCEGITTGLVGETGAGKTTLAKCIMGIIQKPTGRITSGKILYGGKDLLKMNDADLRRIRGNEISMIFQDPMTALNPVMTVGEQIAETFRVHENLSRVEAQKKACEMLELVGIKADRVNDYPHQFSGGMKQRVVIAIALACSPNLLIADEPTTALDVTIQAQVLDMMTSLQKKLGTSTLLITHDLGVVAQTCQKVAIMYAGEVVEYGMVRDILLAPSHPYTKGLINSIPKIHMKEKRLHPVDGLMPDPTNLPEGCAFSPRCAFALEQCRKSRPEMKAISGEHCCRCFLVKTGKENDNA